MIILTEWKELWTENLFWKFQFASLRAVRAHFANFSAFFLRLRGASGVRVCEVCAVPLFTGHKNFVYIRTFLSSKP